MMMPGVALGMIAIIMLESAYFKDSIACLKMTVSTDYFWSMM